MYGSLLKLESLPAICKGRHQKYPNMYIKYLNV